MFGGISTEHEVSVNSARTILKSLDPSRYTPVLIGLNHDGDWRVSERADMLPETLFDSAGGVPCFPTLRAGLDYSSGSGDPQALSAPLDVIFPIIHGRFGEDGALQGLFEVSGIPYVGCGVLATALCMDKILTKRALRDAGLPVVPGHEATRKQVLQSPAELIERVEQDTDYPVFVKPTNTGSSVGVGRARDRAELERCIAVAARYDRNVLVEQAISAREVECAVLGGHEPEASAIGEIGYRGEFYDYEAKYVSESTELMIPAPISEALAARLRSLAVAAFHTLKCWGMARVDFFIDRASEEVYLNELNSLPGFTHGSMYAQLWRQSGIALPELVDRLVELALERQREQNQLVRRFEKA